MVAHRILAIADGVSGKGRCQGDGAPAPGEFLAHGDDEDAEALSGAIGHEGDAYGGGNDVPAVTKMYQP